jgi:hypothetical protein
MSGCTESEVVRVKVLDRALGFLPKPFTSDGLLERVNNVLNPPDGPPKTQRAGASIRLDAKLADAVATHGSHPIVGLGKRLLA